MSNGGRDENGCLQIEAGIPRQLADVKVREDQRQDGEYQMDRVGDGGVHVERSNALRARDVHIPVHHGKGDVNHDTERLLDPNSYIECRHHHHQKHNGDDKERGPAEATFDFSAGRTGRRDLHDYGPLRKVVEGGSDQEKSADMEGEAEEGEKSSDYGVQCCCDLHGVPVLEGVANIPQIQSTNENEQQESKPVPHLDIKAE